MVSEHFRRGGPWPPVGLAFDSVAKEVADFGAAINWTEPVEVDSRARIGGLPGDT